MQASISGLQDPLFGPFIQLVQEVLNEVHCRYVSIQEPGKKNGGCPRATPDIRNLQRRCSVDYGQIECLFRLGVPTRSLPRTLLVQVDQESVIIHSDILQCQADAAHEWQAKILRWRSKDISGACPLDGLVRHN